MTNRNQVIWGYIYLFIHCLFIYLAYETNCCLVLIFLAIEGRQIKLQLNGLFSPVTLLQSISVTLVFPCNTAETE